jgi:AcrR family transcriptional regulator
MDEMIGLRGRRVQSRERTEARRRAIVLAAARVFAQKGYDAATMDDVASQLGVSKVAIYYHFRSKEALHREIRVIAISDSIERLKTIMSRGEPPEPTLRAVIRDLVSHVFADLDKYVILSRSFNRISGQVDKGILDLQRRYRHFVVTILEDGIRQGIFADRDPHLMALTLIRTCFGVAEWYTPGGRLSPDTIVDQVSEQVITGVLRCHT